VLFISFKSKLVNGFFSGLEYAIIFPTLWEYLRQLGVQPSQTFWLGNYAIILVSISCRAPINHLTMVLRKGTKLGLTCKSDVQLLGRWFPYIDGNEVKMSFIRFNFKNGNEVGVNSLFFTLKLYSVFR
jgi:hypothetical protein